MNKQELLNKRLQSAFELSAGSAEVQGYKLDKIDVKHKVIAGAKVGYAGGASRGSGVVSGYIHIDSRFLEYCEDGHLDELINTMKHELAHLIAETFNKKKKTGVWHGQAWKDIFTSLGGDGTRYNTGQRAS